MVRSKPIKRRGDMKRVSKIVCMLFFLPPQVFADGGVVDKVYHPYVQPGERELEWRALSVSGSQLYRLGLGKALTDRLFVEGYLIVEDLDSHLELEAYEVELKWQLTEQGEYDADWGLLFELEKEQHDDTWEASVGLLVEREWGNWVAAVNLYGGYEWGAEIKDEFETSLAMQFRYRYKPYLEPAIEIYKGEAGTGAGPILMGDFRLAPGEKVHWETGVIFGLDSEFGEDTWRVLMEYEF